MLSLHYNHARKVRKVQYMMWTGIQTQRSSVWYMAVSLLLCVCVGVCVCVCVCVCRLASERCLFCSSWHLSVMPAKATIFNCKCDPVYDFGTGHRNMAKYNPHGNNILQSCDTSVHIYCVPPSNHACRILILFSLTLLHSSAWLALEIYEEILWAPNLLVA